MERTLKYRAADVIELIDVVNKIGETEDKMKAVTENIELLSKYPEEDLKKFVDAILALENNNTEVTKDNYQAIIGYIMMRMCL